MSDGVGGLLGYDGLLVLCRLRWLCHIVKMNDDCLPK